MFLSHSTIRIRMRGAYRVRNYVRNSLQQSLEVYPILITTP